MLFLIVSLFLTSPDVSVIVPDSVRTGAVFSFEITVSGENLRSVECSPIFSNGLIYTGTSSMHSFSTVTTPSGTSVSSEIRLTMNFSAAVSGAHTIGPLTLTSSSIKLYEIPIITVTALDLHSGSATAAASTPDAPPIEIAWMEIEIDTTGRVYPGQTFSIDYYIYKTISNAEIVDLFLEPSDYASASLLEDNETLRWTRCKNGHYMTWLAKVEITPAFACTLSLPVLRGRIGIPGGMIRQSREYYISTEGERIPVFPFPELNKPENFSGITDEISFSMERVVRGYSAAGERCVELSVSGPGYLCLRDPPELTVQGPAELIPGRCFSAADDANAWYILVEPTDSGTVIIGPDSIAWFDTDLEEYRQSFIPACTLSVYPTLSRQIDISSIQDSNSDTLWIWIITVIVLLAISTLVLVRYRNRIVGSAPRIHEARDIEELLTAMGYTLSEMLTGSRSYFGSDELDEALGEKAIDAMMSRRLLRHWKDLEMMLSGRTVSPDQLEKLRNKSSELLRELTAELESAIPD